MGFSAKNEVLKKNRLSKNKKLNARLKRVASKIAAAAEKRFAPGYKWEFFLLDSPQINAFCLPGGKIFVYEGLIKSVKNDDELAGVIGHEVAHAILRHGSERVSMAMVGDMTRELLRAGAVLSSNEWSPLYDLAYGLGSTYGILYPYSRKFEYEADQMGLYLAYEACYDPTKAIEFWQRDKKSKKVAEFFSTHPSDAKRAAALREYVKRLRGIKRECPSNLN